MIPVKRFLLLIVLFIFYGCNSNNTDVQTSKPHQGIGYFYDSLVNGIEYSCGSIHGITGDVYSSNPQGGFYYRDDCEVIFKIGKITIGSIDGDKINQNTHQVFPTDLVNVPTTDTSNPKIRNILRILQSLDDDDNTSNGITISQSVRDHLANANARFLNLTDDTLSEDDLNNTMVWSDTNKSIISITRAVSHFEETIRDTLNRQIDTIRPAKPRLIIPFDSIKTRHTIQKTIEIDGEENTHILLGFNKDGNESNVTYTDTNLTMDSNWKQSLTLKFDDNSITHFHYFIALEDNEGHISDPLHLDIVKDFIPPYIETKNIGNTIKEEERYFGSIDAQDAGGIASYEIVPQSMDNRSIDANLFTIDNQGHLSFINEPNFDNPEERRIFKVIARSIDTSGNMTDLLLQIKVENILDNPPELNATDYNTSFLEGLPNGTVVFDASQTLEPDLTIAPDNNRSLSPIYFDLNDTTAFDINRTTGIITIKDENNSLFDYESDIQQITLKLIVENNNTVRPRDYTGDDFNRSYANITFYIQNKIDTAPKLIPVTQEFTVNERDDQSKLITIIKKDIPNCDRDLTMKFSTTYDTKFDMSDNELRTVIPKYGTLDLDYENNHSVYILTIKAENTWYDGSVHSDEVNVTINVNNVVDMDPSINLLPYDKNVSESTAQNITVATLETNGTYRDENTTDYYVLYVTSNDINITNPPFRINNAGIITTTRSLLNDYNESDTNDSLTKFDLYVKAYNTWWDNSIHASNEVKFPLDITNVIDNPPKLKIPTSIALEENQSINSPIYTITTDPIIYDQNVTDAFYIASGNDEGRFDINKTTGEIIVKNNLDWETTDHYILGIKASNIYWDNTEHNSSAVDLEINVSNIIEKVPNITFPSNISIHENIDAEELIGLVEPTNKSTDKQYRDEQTVDQYNFTSSDGNFTLDATTINNLTYGELKTALNNHIDYETQKLYTFDINATNAAGTSASKEINISIIDDVDTNLSLLLVAVGFNDINISEDDADTKNKFFGDPNDDSQRATNKFLNRFNFIKAKETNGTDDDGYMQVDINETHPKTDSTKLKNDIIEALQDLDNDINISYYDKNNNHILDHDELQIIFIIAGGERNYGDDNLSISGGTDNYDDPTIVTMDDVNLTVGSGNFVVVGEKHGDHFATFGFISKYLFLTTFNFPKQNDNTIIYDYFDIMGDGYNGAKSDETNGSRPMNLSAENLIDQGWVNPYTLVNTDSEDFTLYTNNKKTKSDYQYHKFTVLKVNDKDDDKKYYLIENRNVTGGKQDYDDGIENNESNFKGGLVIWEVTLNSANKVDQLKQVQINNSTDNVFRTTNSITDLNNSSFEFTNTGTIDTDTKEFTIGVKVK